MTRTLIVLYGVMRAALAQTAPLPTFEVAAIKPSTLGDTSTHVNWGKGRVVIDNLTLKQLIGTAYGVKDYQLSGGPKWVDSERYHIDAKAEAKVPDAQIMPMLQALLADRFQLTLHREKKTVTGYALLLAKGGPKIHPVEGEGSSMNSNDKKLTAKHVSMDRFATYLARRLDMPVVDETGVAGAFDFVLEFANERQLRAEADGGASAGPSLFTALPEQLGLKLEARKVPVEILVIDRVERPTEN